MFWGLTAVTKSLSHFFFYFFSLFLRFHVYGTPVTSHQLHGQPEGSEIMLDIGLRMTN